MPNYKSIMVPTELGTSVSVFRASKALDTSIAEVVGWLYCLWDHSARNSRHGLLENYSLEDIANCAGGSSRIWQAVADHTPYLKAEANGWRVYGCTSVSRIHKRGIVYFISAPVAKLVKIGFTSKSTADDRRRELQTGSAEPLIIVGVIQGDIARERELHNRFAPYRVIGEWFRIEGALSDFLDTIREATA